MHTPHPDRLLRAVDVEAATGLGRSSFYQLLQDPNPEIRFPQPVKIGQRSRWLESDVQGWIARQKQRSESERTAA